MFLLTVSRQVAVMVHTVSSKLPSNKKEATQVILFCRQCSAIKAAYIGVDGLEDEGIPFALTPAIAIQGILDYRRTSGRKMYSGVIAKVGEEEYFVRESVRY
jgi:hypothetical protein